MRPAAHFLLFLVHFAEPNLVFGGRRRDKESTIIILNGGRCGPGGGGGGPGIIKSGNGKKDGDVVIIGGQDCGPGGGGGHPIPVPVPVPVPIPMKGHGFGHGDLYGSGAGSVEAHRSYFSDSRNDIPPRGQRYHPFQGLFNHRYGNQNQESKDQSSPPDQKAQESAMGGGEMMASPTMYMPPFMMMFPAGSGQGMGASPAMPPGAYPVPIPVPVPVPVLSQSSASNQVNTVMNPIPNDTEYPRIRLRPGSPLSFTVLDLQRLNPHLRLDVVQDVFNQLALHAADHTLTH